MAKYYKFITEDEKEYGIKCVERLVEHDKKTQDVNDEDDFINTYKGYYFLLLDKNNKPKKDLKCPPNITQSYRWVEEKMKEIRDNKEWDKEDVFLILAWKTGHIKQNKRKKRCRCI